MRRRKQRHGYDTLIAVDLCCNDPDNGLFDSQVAALEVGPNLTLECHFCHWSPQLRYRWHNLQHEPKGELGKIVFARKHFPIVEYKPCYGNWCWDRVWMRGTVVIDLLNWLQPKGWFDVGEAEERLFNWWKGGHEWVDSDIRLLAKEFD